MSIKIAVIKTGQQIISKVEEMVYDEKVVGYSLKTRTGKVEA
jgi:hypothetical protein